MKAAVAELEKYLIKQEGVSKGRLVICTVYGDVHDIGKNLVKTILVNNGYTVYDLGKQVPLQKILEKISEVNADAVGLSALLVSTSKQMQYFVEHARQNGIICRYFVVGLQLTPTTSTGSQRRVASTHRVYFSARQLLTG
jgi:5-methyltetrahydrofolate--homocysteine methyltransferase